MSKIGNINAYAVGMGDGNPKAIFTVVDVLEKRLRLRLTKLTSKPLEWLHPKHMLDAAQFALIILHVHLRLHFHEAIYL